MSQAFQSLPAPLPAAVFFDMDGLLIDTESVWFAVETQILGRTRSQLAARRSRASGRQCVARCGAVHRRARGQVGERGTGRAAAARPHARTASHCHGVAGSPRADRRTRRRGHSARVGVIVVSRARRRGARRPGAVDIRRSRRGRRGLAPQAAPRAVSAGCLDARPRPGRLRRVRRFAPRS